MPLFKVRYSELRMFRTTYYVQAPDRHAAECHGEDEDVFDELLRTHAPLTLDPEWKSPECWQEACEVPDIEADPDFIVEPVDEYENRIMSRTTAERVRQIVETETSLCLDDETDRERLIHKLIEQLDKP